MRCGAGEAGAPPTDCDQGLWPKERGPELMRLYGPMNRSLSEICAALTPEQLQVVRDFLRDTAVAGSDAADQVRGAD
jgi:hypothetical protein